jgi:hypothetical protein
MQQNFIGVSSLLKITALIDKSKRHLRLKKSLPGLKKSPAFEKIICQA